jgi:nucleoid DNA-binding protein
MSLLLKNLSKKTGIPKKDLEGLLRVIGFEILEELKNYHRIEFPSLGLFFCVTKEGILSVRIKLYQEAYDRLNKIDDKEEKKDEIIFE